MYSFSYGVSGIGPISQLESISLPSEGWDVELILFVWHLSRESTYVIKRMMKVLYKYTALQTTIATYITLHILS